jgi:hypothetical protein
MATSFQVTFDCADPNRLATFWAAALGYKKQDPPQGFSSWQEFLAARGFPEQRWNSASAVVDPAGEGPRIFFQHVPEPKAVKNRVHLDVNVAGGQAVPIEARRGRVEAEAERLAALGATKLGPLDEMGEFWFVCRTLKATSSAFSKSLLARVLRISILQKEMWKMAVSTHTSMPDVAPVHPVREEAADPTYQAYQILHVGFALLPIIAGLDKFFGLLVNWDEYLAPAIAQLSPIGAHNLMLLVGVVEIVAGLIVWLKPRFGAYLVAAWLWGIILNLIVHGEYFDIAVRDFGLSLGALALARLSDSFDG